jgi:hypothetical protein
VVLASSNPIMGGITDAEGYFRIDKVSLGRHTLRFSCVGYQEAVAHGILVSAGKETMIEMKLEESVILMQDIVISAGNGFEVTNEMATLSARMFNVDETRRYAGSFNDPSRMASNYAGVSGVNDGRNDIIIRGNSPMGLLWRLEGLDIPNPNHYAALGTTGGPVSILNNNLLSNSEFYTGAFPAMYGNAISGVFDLNLRKGNHEKREFLGQIGFNGVELGMEGPFIKGSKSSYLANYRYSVPALFSGLGLSPGTGTATPYYQDMAFNVNIPMNNGRLSFFGIGGLSHIDLLGSGTSAEEAKKDLYGDLSFDVYNTAQMGVAAISHLHFFNKTTYWQNSFAVSYAGFGVKVDTVIRNPNLEIEGVADFINSDYIQTKYTYGTQLNKKVSARNTLTTGLSAEVYQMDLIRENLWKQRATVNEIAFDGATVLLKSYLAWQHKFTDKWILNSGVNYQCLTLNKNSREIEPRIGLKYQFRNNQSISMGYGKHSQMQGMEIYFIETATPFGKAKTNRDLGFTLSNHFVAAYNWQMRPDLLLKIEGYYQNIDRVPVRSSPSLFSMLNAGADFGLPNEDSLVNAGTGYTNGLELTLEKFFSDSYYFLVTGSLFDSKYKGSDGVLRNTAFNGNYVMNGLFGKEWRVGKRNNSFAIDAKYTVAGNRRYIPIHVEASIQQGKTIYDYSGAYQDRYLRYMRVDTKFTFRKQHRRVTEEFTLDIQNVLNNKNPYRESYNVLTETVGMTYQLGIWPMMQYRILF